jgi:hypothetical protein
MGAPFGPMEVRLTRFRLAFPVVMMPARSIMHRVETLHSRTRGDDR